MMQNKRSLILLAVAVVAAIVAAIFIIGNPFRRGEDTESATKEAVTTPSSTSDVAEGPQAPEIRGIEAWINSEPLALADLRGKVVLVDFWTYTCVNCIRTFPYLKQWHSKYADNDLVIIGVHTPEFNFEEKTENVRQATKDNSILWPVAQDNDYETWDAYRNQFWPAKYLIDKDGVIRYTHFGEGAYAETEAVIRELLQEAGTLNPSRDINTLPTDPALDPTFLEDTSAGITRELYGGYERGYNLFGGLYVRNDEYYADSDTITSYDDSFEEREKNLLYLQGDWYNGPESLRHARETTNYEDYIAVKFAAKSANAVITPRDGKPLKVLVTLDGQPLDASNKGADVVIEKDGGSFLLVDEARMYKVVEAPSYGVYDLKLSSNSDDFELFAFTFGVYASGV